MSKNAPRSAARLAAVQALFQMDAAGTGVESVILEFTNHRFLETTDDIDLHDVDQSFFMQIVRGAVESQSNIDRYIENKLAENWTLSRVDATARAILRAGLFELIRLPDVPYKVVIDEYIDIANSFFDGDDHKFINAVLDAAAHDARSDEMKKVSVQ